MSAAEIRSRTGRGREGCGRLEGDLEEERSAWGDWDRGEYSERAKSSDAKA